jgi:hypothetical protein
MNMEGVSKFYLSGVKLGSVESMVNTRDKGKTRQVFLFIIQNGV